MRTLSICLYKFDELSQKAKKNAIDYLKEDDFFDDMSLEQMVDKLTNEYYEFNVDGIMYNENEEFRIWKY